MSRLLTRAVLWVFLPFILFGCSAEPAIRVLFIGNSYTAANDLPGMVRDLANSVGRDVEIEAVVPGGWWLRDHASSPDTLNRIAEGGFDYVVLQEQSMVPADRGPGRPRVPHCGRVPRVGGHTGRRPGRPLHDMGSSQRVG